MNNPSTESLARWLTAVDRFATADAHKVPRGILGVGTTRAQWLALTVDERRARLQVYVARDPLRRTPPTDAARVAPPTPTTPACTEEESPQAALAAPTSLASPVAAQVGASRRRPARALHAPSSYVARCLGGCDTYLPAHPVRPRLARCPDCKAGHEDAERRKAAAARNARRRAEAAEQRAA